MAVRMARLRRSISTSETLGLPTVNIRAAVSPKSLMNWIGPAPWGKSLTVLRRRAMSSKTLPMSVRPSLSKM